MAVKGLFFVNPEGLFLRAKFKHSLNWNDPVFVVQSRRDYCGSVIEEDMSVKAKQYFNPKHADILEKNFNIQEGTYLIHEVLESYIGALIHPGAKGANQSSSDEEYAKFLDTHNKAESIDENFRSIRFSFSDDKSYFYFYDESGKEVKITE